MSTAQLERRLQAVEAELARLNARLAASNGPHVDDWRSTIGSFAGDPYHAEAMRLGRQYREAQRPKRAKPQPKSKRRR
jgi:hypothetical protein